MALLEDIRFKLQVDNVFDGSTWKCYLGYMPDEQNQVIGIFESGGLPSNTLNRENTLPSFQVRIRASQQDYVVCRNKWQAVYNSLQDASESNGSPETLVGYYLIQALASAPLVWTDELQRVNMSVNFRVIKSK